MVCKECKAPGVLFNCKECGEDTCNKCHIKFIEEQLGEKSKIRNGSDCLRCGAKKSMALRTALTEKAKSKDNRLAQHLNKSKMGAGQTNDQIYEAKTVGIVLGGTTKKEVKKNLKKDLLASSLMSGGGSGRK